LYAELGHWKLRHTPINFVMGQFITLANFLLFAGVRTAPGLFESFGFDKSRPAFIAFVLFQYLVSPVDEVGPLAVLLHENDALSMYCERSVCCCMPLVSCNQLVMNANAQSASASTQRCMRCAQHAVLALSCTLCVAAAPAQVIGFCTNVVSRRFEYQADGFAVQQGKGKELREALLKLEETNKASLNVDPLYSAYHHSHPHITERLASIDAALKKGQ
jgi:STE24 endopeptidase